MAIYANKSNVDCLQLLQVTNIGDWKVNCYIPMSDQFQIGVISPIDITENLNAVQNFCSDNESRIHKIERIMRSDSEGNKIPTTTVKIMFETTVLPQQVKMYHFSNKVRPYVPIPIMCYRCQRLGHTAMNCSAAKARCLLCSGNHAFKECPNPNQLCCANCNGKH